MLAWVSRKILELSGWQLIGEPPTLKKYVVIVAPHTSNWDFFIFLLLKFIYGLRVSFIGKHTIFIGPVGWFLRRIGGIPVNREKNDKVVDTIVEAFNSQEEMIFALSPEGTRSYKNYWKTGFYHIARNANVPVQTCFLDVVTHTIGFGPLLHLTGDIGKDFEKLTKIYSDKAGFRADLFSRIAYRNK